MTHRLLPKPDVGADDAGPGDATEPKWEFDEDSGRYYVPFRTISRGAQLGRSGIFAFGVVFICVGSIVGP